MEKKVAIFCYVCKFKYNFPTFSNYITLYMCVCARVLGIPNLRHKHVLVLHLKKIQILQNFATHY